LLEICLDNAGETGDDPNQKSTNQGGDFFNEQKVPRQKLMT